MKTPERDPHLIFVGMPTFDGNLTGPTQTLWDLFAEGKRIGPYSFIRRQVKCYSSAKARNILTAMAFTTAASKLLMIDADSNASELQVARILGHKLQVVGGFYPKKMLSRNQLWVATLLKDPGADGLAPALEVGAGFMAIDIQQVIGRMIAKYPALRYLCDDEQMKGANMWNLWGEVVATENWEGRGAWPRLLTDDYAFCWRAPQLGLSVWVDTVCQVGHVGLVDFLQVIAMMQQCEAIGAAKMKDALCPGGQAGLPEQAAGGAS